MGNSVKLVNGSTIQVRTGVIQGIGPVGPRGAVGETGPQGDQGPIGPTGPMGVIYNQMSRAKLSATNPVAANTDTVLGTFVSDVDAIGINKTQSVFQLVANPGDFMMSCWVRFDDATAGLREVWFLTGATIIARSSRMSVAGAPFYCDLTHPYHSALGNESFSVVVRSQVACNVSDGVMAFNRIGSGPQGVPGPPGVQGVQGPQGGKGDTGASGSASTGFTTYALLLPH